MAKLPIAEIKGYWMVKVLHAKIVGKRCADWRGPVSTGNIGFSLGPRQNADRLEAKLGLRDRTSRTYPPECSANVCSRALKAFTVYSDATQIARSAAAIAAELSGGA
jgi:hypothetical protein